jgi:hypothetical protein
VCVCVCVCVLFVDLFQDDLRCLFSPHQVNHGGAQKSPLPQVSLYKSHTTEESLRRHSFERLWLNPGSYVLTMSNETEAPTCHEWVRKVTSPDEELKIIVFSPFVLHYIDEVL